MPVSLSASSVCHYVHVLYLPDCRPVCVSVRLSCLSLSVCVSVCLLCPPVCLRASFVCLFTDPSVYFYAFSSSFFFFSVFIFFFGGGLFVCPTCQCLSFLPACQYICLSAVRLLSCSSLQRPRSTIRFRPMIGSLVSENQWEGPMKWRIR